MIFRKVASSIICETPAKSSATSITRLNPSSGIVSPTQQQTYSTSNDDGEPSFGAWQPNQLTMIFQRMEATCPDDLKAYARCVVEKQNKGALVQGACEESFQRVMDCYRTVRR
ncbi:hypothetical protein HJC23_010439 [Cyclotella cryptica]|uniref:COX assembly mitochondrial protein n=1 Tax=Cyclotella cryptica TaxID=29204 RepID=A0ABD3QI09_9STRA|eukprot:CCRYP_005301-RA/>CCRYP_005301-RA protein AED:0.24 eAED:0.24 QI:267/1/1/1/0/0/2/183/112